MEAVLRGHVHKGLRPQNRRQFLQELKYQNKNLIMPSKQSQLSVQDADDQLQTNTALLLQVQQMQQWNQPV